MSVESLRVAVVGAGVMGRYHALNYATMPGVKLVAAVDSNLERRSAMADMHGCATYASVEALLANESIDAASVAVPTSLHFSVAQALLSAGVHVLVEKPVATDVAQARALAQLSDNAALVLQVGHITRFYAAVQTLSQVVKAPYLVEARRLVPSERVTDVGVILDLMIHDLDIVLGLVRGEPVQVTAAGHSLNGSLHEDVAAAQILFDNGCIARFLASRVSPDQERSLLVAERHQTVRIDFAKEPYTEMFIYRTPPTRVISGHVTVDKHVVHEENPLRKELEHFVARIRGATEPIGTLKDDMRALALANQLLAAVRAGGSLATA